MTGYRHEPGPDNPVDAVIDKPFTFDNLRQVMTRMIANAEGERPAPADDVGLAN
jgi:hypothetical protein